MRCRRRRADAAPCLAGCRGWRRGRVVILGGGVAGAEAAAMAVGLQAEVSILDKSIDRLRELGQHFAGRVRLLMASRQNVVGRSAGRGLGGRRGPGARSRRTQAGHAVPWCGR